MATGSNFFDEMTRENTYSIFTAIRMIVTQHKGHKRRVRKNIKNRIYTAIFTDNKSSIPFELGLCFSLYLRPALRRFSYLLVDFLKFYEGCVELRGDCHTTAHSKLPASHVELWFVWNFLVLYYFFGLPEQCKWQKHKMWTNSLSLRRVSMKQTSYMQYSNASVATILPFLPEWKDGKFRVI